MKIEKINHNYSVIETILYFIPLFILINISIFIVNILMDKAVFLINDTSWIFQILFPVMFSVVQTAVNRNGEMKITEFENKTDLLGKINALAKKRGFVAIAENETNMSFAKRTAFQRFLNFFFKENLLIKNSDNEIIVLSKRNFLDLLEMKLKFNQPN